jgi:hypothetical protein
LLSSGCLAPNVYVTIFLMNVLSLKNYIFHIFRHKSQSISLIVFLTVSGLLMWGALSDEKSGL